MVRTPHPAVVAAGRLHQLLTAAVGDTVRVDLGPQEGTTESLDLMAVGLSTEDFSVVSGTVEAAGLGFQQEVMDIGCMAQSVSGDDDVLARMDRCFELMDLAASLIEADDDGEVTWGRIVRHQTQWVTGPGGIGALVLFAVGVDAHRPVPRRRDTP